MPSVYKPYPALRVQLRTAGFHAHAQLPLCKNKIQLLPKTGYRGRLDKNRSSCGGSVDYGSRNLIFMLLFHGQRIMPVPVGNKALAENASRASEHVLQLQTDLVQLPRTEQASQFCLLCYFTHFLRAAGRRCAKRIQHLPGFRRFLYSRLRPFLIQNGRQSVDPLPGTLRGCSFLQQLTDFVKFQHPIDIVHFSYSLPQINEKSRRTNRLPVS